MKNSDFLVNVDGKEIKLRTRVLSPEIKLASQEYYAKALNKALEDNCKLRIEMQDLLKKKGLYDPDKDDKDSEELRKLIKSKEVELRGGVIGTRKMTKEEGRTLALEIKNLRSQLAKIGNQTSGLFDNTAENIADNERIQYFIFACTVHADTGKTYWKSFEEFKSEPNDSQVLADAGRNFLSAIYGIDKDYEKNLYENKWLIRMGFMDDKLRLLNSDGKVVDEEGRLLDDEGRFVDSEGNYLDAYGNKIDKEGNLLVPDAWDLDKSPEVKVS